MWTTSFARGSIRPHCPNALAATGPTWSDARRNSSWARPWCCPRESRRRRPALRKAGHSLDPRRIDIYQIGTLLCRLLTGETILAYMYDPTIKAKVPAAARAVLQRAIGEAEAEPYGTCDELIAALDESVRGAEPARPQAAQRDTPAEGSVVLPPGDTPPEGRKPAVPPEQTEGPALKQVGHYRILGRIGRGGMGDVYQGYDESLDREVAIKVLPPELARDQDFVRRFHQRGHGRRAAWPIPTSCPCTSAAKTPGTISSPCSSSKASRWPSVWPASGVCR